MKKKDLDKKNATRYEIKIRSSAAEYLTFIAATGDNPDSIEMRYEDENVWLTQKMMENNTTRNTTTCNLLLL
jgi:hypothetical protein